PTPDDGLRRATAPPARGRPPALPADERELRAVRAARPGAARSRRAPPRAAGARARRARALPHGGRRVSRSRDPRSPGGAATAPGFARAIDAFDRHLAVERNLSDHTRRAYRSDLRQLAAFLGPA